MKARKLKKILNDTGYIINNQDDYIAVGSPLCHNLISVDKKTLKIKYALDTWNTGRQSLGHNEELGLIWDKLKELIDNGEIHDIINGNDEIDNPIPVYSIEEGELVVNWTHEYGWPNTTIDGTFMYENTHFKTRKEAIENGIREYKNRYEYRRERLEELKEKIQKIEDDIIFTDKTLNYLNTLLENETNQNA
jgi:hypothetical protein